jgi:hypothetical protein
LLHVVAPVALKVPAGHSADGGVDVVEPGGHAYPALHTLHDVAPDNAKVPAVHIAASGVDEIEPAGHA